MEWDLYAQYCFARMNGLRSDSFSYLDQFLKIAGDWTFDERKKFTCFLLEYIEACDEPDYDIFPHPLYENLIKPTLNKWCESEKMDSKPFRWSGSQDVLLKALEINPFDDKARETLLQKWMHQIYFSVHHLPDGYIGDINADLPLLDKIKEQIGLLQNSEKQKDFTQSMAEDEELILNYKEWKKSGADNFKQWGIDHKKKVGYRYSYKD